MSKYAVTLFMCLGLAYLIGFALFTANVISTCDMEKDPWPLSPCEYRQERIVDTDPEKRAMRLGVPSRVPFSVSEPTSR